MVEPGVMGSKLGVSHIWTGGPLDRDVTNRLRLTLNCKKPIGISGGALVGDSRLRAWTSHCRERSPQDEAALRKFLHQDVVGR